MRKLIRMLILFLIFCLAALPALAEDVCTVKDASAATRVTTEASYLKVLCPLAGDTPVTLSVWDEWGYLIYQRNYGVCSGTFRSGEVHLPLEGESCEYTVTVSTGEGEYTFTVLREMAMITDSSVYAGGATLEQLVDGSSRKFALVLDMDAMNEETLIVPMMASGMQVGEVYFTVLDGELTVSASLMAEGQIDKANVYIATDAITASTLGTSRFSGMKTRLDRTVDLGSTPYAAVMVQLTITYDPATAWPFDMGREEKKALEELMENWQLMQMTTANEAVG